MAVKLHHDHVALVVVDMQNAAGHPSGTFAKLGFDTSPTLDIVPTIKSLITSFQKKYAGQILQKPHLPSLLTTDRGNRGLPVIFAKMEWNADYSDAGLLAAHRPGAAIKQVQGWIRNTWDTDILDQLKPFLDDANTSVLSKTRNSAFHSTRFAAQLKERGIEQLVVTGVLTNACVERTVRDAFSEGFRVLIPREATATWSKTIKEASLENMGWFGDVVGVEDVLSALDSA